MRCWIVLAVIFGVSCDKPEDPEMVLEEVGEFFDPDVLEGTASLAGWSEVPCPGSSKDERSAENPSGIMRGEVDATLGYSSNIRVQLVEVDESLEVNTVLHETRTDGLGRFCFKLPPKVSVGPHLMVRVGNDGQLILRRMVLDLQDVNVGAVHEALVRLVEEKKTPLKSPNLINLHTVGYTAADLLNATQSTSQGAESEVKYLVSVLREDDRASALLRAK